MEPALNTAELSATGGSEGATDVQNFANSQTEKMENAIATGDTEKLTSVVAIAVSNIVDIKVGIHVFCVSIFYAMQHHTRSILNWY